MKVSKLQNDLTLCLDTLDRIITERIKSDHNKELSLSRFKSEAFENALNKVIQLAFPLSFEEKLILLLAISSYIKPGFLDDILTREVPEGGKLKGFGGKKVKQHFGLLPTAETALFLLAGNNPSGRLKYQKIFENEKASGVMSLLYLEPVSNKEHLMTGRLLPDPFWLEKILTSLKISPAFPVQKISTSLLWEDLVLPLETRENINEIAIWLRRRKELLKDPASNRKKTGYKVLFQGASGTGKTLTAALLGKKFNIPVYRIDLSQVVSKYIGETEKNLGKLFADARKNDWILFFDEADALFGKRTSVNDSHDKYANQEVSYLLQQIENFEGILIMAARLKNIRDEAFIGRFNYIVHFPTSEPEEA